MAPTPVALQITTQSQDMSSPQSAVNPPKITLDGNPFPEPAGNALDWGSGFQVVVLDPAMDLTSPNAIRTNTWVALQSDNGSWMDTYPWMYDNIVTQVLSSGNPAQQIVFLVSFGLDANLPPTAEALELFLGLGAGPAVQQWEAVPDRGSQGGGWVQYPANYVLVGMPQYGYGEGTEQFDFPQSGPVTTTVQATLTNFGGS